MNTQGGGFVDTGAPRTRGSGIVKRCDGAAAGERCRHTIPSRKEVAIEGKPKAPCSITCILSRTP